MKNMETETKWSVIFAVVTVISVIGEVISGGVSAASIFAAVKDISGTAIVFAMLIVFIKSNRKEKLNFDEKLEKALTDWQQENANMIVRKPEHDNNEFYSLDAKTDVSDFYSRPGETEKTGLFLRMPPLKEENYNKGNIPITFSLNKSTFFGDISKEKLTSESYKSIANRFVKLFNTKHLGFANAKLAEGGTKILVTISNPIETEDDINALVDAINTMYTSYLVSARIKVETADEKPESRGAEDK